MSLFRVYLSGSTQALDVEFAASGIDELKRGLLHERYLQGRVESLNNGTDYAGILIPASRVQLILEL